MIGHELKKLLHSKVTVILMILFLAINGFLVWNLPIPGVEPYINIDVTHILSLYRALPEDGKQALSALEEKRDVFTEAIWNETEPGGYLTEDIYTERLLFQTLIDRIEPVVNYSVILQEIDTNAETLLLTGRYETDSFPYQNVVKSGQVYAELQNVQPMILYSGAVELMPGGGITEIIVVLLSLLIALELVFLERERGTLALCKSTGKGYGHLILGKILAGLIWGTVGTIILYGSNLLIGLIRCGSVALSAPIQSVYGMIRSPWKLTIGEYMGLFFAVKILWTGSVMAVAYVGSYVGKKVWQCCGVFLLLGGICFLRPNSLLNPFSVETSSELFGNYWNLNIFGSPVSHLAASVWGMVSIIFPGFFGAAYLHVKQIPGIFEKNGRRKKNKMSSPTSLIKYEAGKLFLMNGGLYILILLIVVQGFIYSDFSNYIPPQEQLYIHYSRILAGTANAEKDAYLEQEETRFADLYHRLEEYGQALGQGSLSEDSYSLLTGGIMQQLESEPVFLRARDQYLRMKENGLEYVCLTGYNRLLGAEGKKEFLRQSIFLVLGLTAGLSGVFATEHETGMIFLLRTAEMEPDSQKKKRLLAVLYGFAVAVIVYVPQLVAVWVSYGLPGMSAMAVSVPSLGLRIGKVWCAMGIYGGMLAVIAVGMSLLILILSNFCRNTVHTCLYSGAILLPPFVLGLVFV